MMFLIFNLANNVGILLVMIYDNSTNLVKMVNSMSFLAYLLNIAGYIMIWIFVLLFFKEHHYDTYLQIRCRVNTFFLTIQIFLVSRVIIYFVLCPSLGSPVVNSFLVQFLALNIMYLTEILLGFFIMHLSLQTIKSNTSSQHNSQGLRRTRGVVGSIVSAFDEAQEKKLVESFAE